MKTRQILILFFILSFITAEFFSFVKLNSERVQPPPAYAGNPPAYQDCSYCHPHSGPVHDSTAFLLSIGPDTTHLLSFTSGVTTYTPNQVYYLRLRATHIRPVYGFELTAADSAGIGSDVSSFTILDTTNTSLANIGIYGMYVGHHNATQNNQWTFQWSAPAAYTGSITFYWAGNDADGIDSNPPVGDTIYLTQKTIYATPGAGISENPNELTDVSIFPAVCSAYFQVRFNMVNKNHVKGQLFDMQGQMVQTVLDEIVNPGTYSHVVDVSRLSAGIYLLKMQAGMTCLTQKIIRQ